MRRWLIPVLEHCLNILIRLMFSVLLLVSIFSLVLFKIVGNEVTAYNHARYHEILQSNNELALFVPLQIPKNEIEVGSLIEPITSVQTYVYLFKEELIVGKWHNKSWEVTINVGDFAELFVQNEALYITIHKINAADETTIVSQ